MNILALYAYVSLVVISTGSLVSWLIFTNNKTKFVAASYTIFAILGVVGLLIPLNKAEFLSIGFLYALILILFFLLYPILMSRLMGSIAVLRKYSAIFFILLFAISLLISRFLMQIILR